MIRIAIAFACFVVLALVGPANAESRSESVSYKSSNITFMYQALRGGLKDDPVTLKGQLYLPEGKGAVPVVIWQHGSSHPDNPGYQDWLGALRAALADEGIGYFVADSYTARGISDTGKDQGKLSRASRVIDGWRALEAVARHPRVDPVRVGIIGTSFGGLVALWTTHEIFAKAVLPNGPRFAAHVSLYPPCGAHFEGYTPMGAPLLFLLGEADDWTPAAWCVDSAAKLREQGATVEVVTYAEAHHGFVTSQSVRHLPKVWNMSGCEIATIGPDGVSQSVYGTNADLPSWRPLIRRVVKSGCVSRGAHAGNHEEAAADALKRTVAFFAQHLKG